MRLLLAEDEEDLSRALVTVLKHNNYSVDAVYDGAEALDYLENVDNYDGVILDIMMPKMDGLTVLKTIRKHGNSVPVLLLTAKAEIDDRVEGLDSGADDYLPKPFSMKELLARIRAMTRQQAETTESVLKFGDLALNRATYQLIGPENADGSGPFGKTWEEIPLFARIIHLCDILDAFCRTPVFDDAVWQRAKDYLLKNKGTKFDTACVDTFLEVFGQEHFLSLGDADLEERLWNIVPRKKRDLSDEMCKNFANLFLLP